MKGKVRCNSLRERGHRLGYPLLEVLRALLFVVYAFTKTYKHEWALGFALTLVARTLILPFSGPVIVGLRWFWQLRKCACCRRHRLTPRRARTASRVTPPARSLLPDWVAQPQQSAHRHGHKHADDVAFSQLLRSLTRAHVAGWGLRPE